MSIEQFDHGATKAAGFVVVGANPGASSAVGLGLVGMVRNGTGDVTLEFSEAIAEAEFHALATLIDTDGSVKVTWENDNFASVVIKSDAGAAIAGSFCFVFRRLQGGAGVPVAAAPT